MKTALTRDAMFKAAPSIFATAPFADVSDKYTFIPTIDIIDIIEQQGFLPVRVQQSVARTPGKSDFTKHMIRFRRESDLTDTPPRIVNGNAHYFYAEGEQRPEIPEIVLVNSHDRSSGFQLSAALFRQICSNGAVVKSGTIGDISVRHSGHIEDDVLEGVFTIVNEMPAILDKVDEFKQIKLLPQQAMAFADAALQLRYPLTEEVIGAPVHPKAPILAEQLLNVRRREDAGSDLWSVYNRVQENMMKGGVRGRGTTGKRMSTRAIGSVTEDIRLNKSLWFLTEQMAKLAA